MKALKIYLAEDDTDDIDCFKEALREVDKNCTVTVFSNGAELLDKLCSPAAFLPDIVLMDINMPLMNGMECLKQIRSNAVFKDVPIIMLTTSSSLSTIEITYRLGASLFIIKPCSYKDQKKMLSSILEIDWNAISRPASSAAFLYDYH